ncbi:unnamed protein product [Owenia fusiformis]|uniref:Uncharacterized protein n=1 Tax=Owenia fusiformis TaxID=6347 RepID=A0A8J1XIP9_OWEFU|nr:unnamed protein product [Owenia fusiformis]
MATKATNTTEEPLADLLNRFEVANVRDTHDLSGGHLNESNMLKHAEISNRKPWESSQKPHINMREAGKLQHGGKKNNESQKTMLDTLINFSMGTAGTLESPTKVPEMPNPIKFMQPDLTYKLEPIDNKSKPKSRQKSPVNTLHTETIPRAADQKHEKSLQQETMKNPRLLDQTFIQELTIPDLMLPKSKYHDSDYIDSGRDSPKHVFVPNHLTAITKKDQHRQIKDFEQTIVRKHETMEQNVLSGVKAVEHLERKLREDLDTLEYDGYGPNFHRLQVYSNVYEDLIADSPTLSYILKTIKAEYDNYISSLLDSQAPQHSILNEQVEQLQARGTSKPELLNREQERLKKLESRAKELLDQSDKLHADIEEANELLAEAEAIEPPKRSTLYHEETKLDPSDQVEELHTAILEKLDQMKVIRDGLHEKYVPLSVCGHLEQCIKESDIEVQKLLKQNEFFEKGNNELEGDLKEAIQGAELSEREHRKVNRRIDGVMSLDSSRSTASSVRSVKSKVAGTAQGETGDVAPHLSEGEDEPVNEDESDDDDDDKWEFYIS